MSGGGLDLSYIRDSNQCGSLIWMGYPGQSGGLALANVMYLVNIILVDVYQLHIILHHMSMLLVCLICKCDHHQQILVEHINFIQENQFLNLVMVFHIQHLIIHGIMIQ